MKLYFLLPSLAIAGALKSIDLPFGSAAKFAATAPGLRQCDHWDRCPSANAAMEAWRYVVNNADKAAAHATMRTEDHLHVEEELRTLRKMLKQYNSYPSRHSFERATVAGRILFQHYGDVLSGENNTVVLPPAPEGRPSGIGYMDDVTKSVAMKTTNKVDTITAKLSNGVTMPLVAASWWNITGTAAYETTRFALGMGIRHIVSGISYDNENEIGTAIEMSGIPREKLFITGKMCHTARFFGNNPERAFNQQMKRLKIDKFDLYLLNRIPSEEINKNNLKTYWRFMEKMYEEGRVRAIGLSHFTREKIDEVLTFAKIKPHVIQNKFSVYHPGEVHLKETSMMHYVREKKMVMLGSSVLSPWPLLLPALEDPHVNAIATRIKKKPSQVLFRWALQMGAGFIMRSTERMRYMDAVEVGKFSLSNEDMRLLNGLVSLAGSVDHELFFPGFSEDVYHLKPETVERTNMHRDEL